MKRQSDKAKTVTIYSEKYYARENHVMPHVALQVARDADVIYAVEQGEIEIPSFGKQRRMVCVFRFERIIRPDAAVETHSACDEVGQSLVTGEDERAD